MFTLIENGEVYAPDKLGKTSVLLVNDCIAMVGAIEPAALKSTGLNVDMIDASGCVVTPGLIDPHQHLLGGSGEEGFASQTPEISLSEIATAGITTVVGCLGSDTKMKTLPGLLAKVKGLKEEGLNARMWSGGYRVPPASITASYNDDIMFIDEVIGTGEVAISDERSSDPSKEELARVAHETHLAGKLSNKAGVVHVHVGEAESRLKIIRDVIKEHAVKPEWFYVTHISRSEKLMNEAIELAKNGSFVDIDTVDENLAECLSFYLDNYGWEEKLTLSSDASKTSPKNLICQIRSCVKEHGFPLEKILPFATSNTACVLKLEKAGKIAPGMCADVLVMRQEDLAIVELISRGRRLIKNGKLDFKEKFLNECNRLIELEGLKIENPNNSTSANGNSYNGFSSNGNRPQKSAQKKQASDQVMCKAK
jgi:beta-aspartyl-dipeptidase (metallo-type)